MVKLGDYKIKSITLISLVLAVLLTVSGSYYFYIYSKNKIKSEKLIELKTIAELKASQIENWRSERLSEVVFFSKNKDVRNNIILLINGDYSSEVLLEKSLGHIISNNKFENIFILNPEGKLLFSLDTNLVVIDPVTINVSKESFRYKEILFADLYDCKTHNEIHLDIAAPVVHNNVAIATIIFRINADDFLYPLVQDWPTPSKTAETLLIRKNDDSVQFLNRLRHSNADPLKFKISLEKLEIPAVSAVLGKTGFFEGLDYRGVPVISEIRPIANSKWIMIAKVDKSEIFSELNYLTYSIAIITFLIVLFIVSTTAWVYINSQRKLYKELYLKKEELHETQEEFRATLYSIGDGVITTDRKGNVKQLNTVAEKLTGWLESDAKGKKVEEVFNIVNEETRGRVENPVNKVLEHGLIVGLANHTILISRDGNEVPIADSGAPIKDNDGNVIGVVLVFRDQTEERAQQKALQESEERFAHLFERAPLGYQSLTEDGCFIEVNDAWLETLGYARDEVIGHWFGEFVPPKYIEKFRESFQLFKKNGRTHTEFEMIHKGGEQRFISFDGRIGHKLDGSFDKTHCILKDITEEKLIEKELRESEEKFRLVMENSMEAIFITIPDGRIINANKSACDLFGMTEAELCKAGRDGIVDKSDEKLNILLEEREKTGKAFGTLTFIKKSGEKFIAEISSSVFNNSKGELRTTMIIRDITERIKSENTIKEAESFIRSAFDGISSHIAVVDNKGEILAVNKAWRAFADANQPILVNVNEGANYIEACDRAIGDEAITARKFAKHLKALLAGEIDLYEMEYPCHSDSESRWFIARISKFPGDGNPKAIIAHENITSRKLTELELSKNRAFIMSVIENLPIGLAVNSVDPTVAFEYMNSNFAKFYGTTLEALSSPDSFWEAVYEDSAFREEIKNRVLSDISSGNPEKMVWKDIPITRNGKLINYITARNIPLYDKNLMISTVWDVTDRKLGEEQITKLNNNLKILITALNELTTAQSLDDIVKIVTNSARRLIGSDGCTFVLKDSDSCFYIDEDSISPLWKGKRFLLNTCIAGWVMLNKQVAIIPDVYADDRVPIDVYEPTFVKSMVMVPINASQVYGAIGNYWSNNYTPTASEIKLIETLADATARVYENIRLFGDLELKVSEKTKELNERIEELERFHDATIDREIRMKELRDEIERLKNKG